MGLVRSSLASSGVSDWLPPAAEPSSGSSGPNCSVEPLNEAVALAGAAGISLEVGVVGVGVPRDRSRDRKLGLLLCSIDKVRVPASRTSMEACKRCGNYALINKCSEVILKDIEGH